MFYPYNYKEKCLFSRPLTINANLASNQEEKSKIIRKNKVIIFEYLTKQKFPEDYDPALKGYKEEINGQIIEKKWREIKSLNINLFDSIKEIDTEYQIRQDNISSKFLKMGIPSDLDFLGKIIWGSWVWITCWKFITNSEWNQKINQRTNKQTSLINTGKYFIIVGWMTGLWKTTLGRFLAKSLWNWKNVGEISYDLIRPTITNWNNRDFSKEDIVKAKRNYEIIKMCSVDKKDIIVWTDVDNWKGKLETISYANEQEINNYFSNWNINFQKVEEQMRRLDFAIKTAKNNGYTVLWIFLEATPEQIFSNLATRYRQIDKAWVDNSLNKYTYQNFSTWNFDILLRINPLENLSFKKDLKDALDTHINAIF